jgi:hypothetical protein
MYEISVQVAAGVLVALVIFGPFLAGGWLGWLASAYWRMPDGTLVFPGQRVFLALVGATVGGGVTWVILAYIRHVAGG